MRVSHPPDGHPVLLLSLSRWPESGGVRNRRWVSEHLLAELLHLPLVVDVLVEGDREDLAQEFRVLALGLRGSLHLAVHLFPPLYGRVVGCLEGGAVLSSPYFLLVVAPFVLQGGQLQLLCVEFGRLGGLEASDALVETCDVDPLPPWHVLDPGHHPE